MSAQGKEVRDFSKPDQDFIEGVFVTPSGGEANRRMSTTTLPMDDADAKSTTVYPAFRDGLNYNLRREKWSFWFHLSQEAMRRN